jgi:hypothetical protein
VRLTRRSHFGHDPGWIDEDLLAGIAEQNHVRLTIPSNTGVVLMNNQMWLRIDYELFIEFAWRLLVGACMKIDFEPDLVVVRDHSLEHDRGNAICYPAKSGWIADEIAFWLCLGAIPGLTEGVLDRRDVIQGSETYPLPVTIPWLAHYWSGGQSQFFSQVDHLP